VLGSRWESCQENVTGNKISSDQNLSRNVAAILPGFCNRKQNSRQPKSQWFHSGSYPVLLQQKTMWLFDTLISGTCSNIFFCSLNIDHSTYLLGHPSSAFIVHLTWWGGCLIPENSPIGESKFRPVKLPEGQHLFLERAVQKSTQYYMPFSPHSDKFTLSITETR